jgi:hypothetical protein
MDQIIAWEMVYPLGIIILAIGIAFGMWRYSKRNRADTREANAVVRDRYEHPGKWDGNKTEADKG